METTGSRWQGLQRWLFAPEPALAMAVYRMLWGGLMAWESWRYYVNGWVYRYYVAPTVLFKYPGFDWIPDPSGPMVAALSIVMIVSGVLVSAGFLYRAASVAFFVAHTYQFLLGAANYLNHAYLISLLAGLMILMPAHRTLSVDAWLWPRRSTTVPHWPRALLRAQLGIVYVYGAIAKLNTDWWVYHQPIRRWMQNSADRVAKTPWIRSFDGLRAWMSPEGTPWPKALHDAVASEGFTVFIAYGGVAFDLLIAPALLWRRTRPFAAAVAVGFHVSNMHLFSIGVFPWLMLAATTLFFEPTWVQRLPWLGPRLERVAQWLSGRATREPSTPRRTSLWAGLWVGWLVVQLVVPLRHHLYAGDVAWTEEGHYYAWRMKLRSKRGSVRYRVVDTVSGQSWTVDPAEELTKRQARKIRGKPDLIRQYANHLVRRYRDEGKTVEVYVDAFTALNYRRAQRFIDPEHELGHESRSWGAAPWILPMKWTPPPHPGDSQ